MHLTLNRDSYFFVCGHADDYVMMIYNFLKIKHSGIGGSCFTEDFICSDKFLVLVRLGSSNHVKPKTDEKTYMSMFIKFIASMVNVSTSLQEPVIVQLIAIL